MVKKLSRQQKAANARKANQLKASKKIAIKLGLIKNEPWKVSENQVGPAIYTPTPVLALCGQLEDAILLLETRISNAIAKINSLM